MTLKPRRGMPGIAPLKRRSTSPTEPRPSVLSTGPKHAGGQHGGERAAGALRRHEIPGGAFGDGLWTCDRASGPCPSRRSSRSRPFRCPGCSAADSRRAPDDGHDDAADARLQRRAQHPQRAVARQQRRDRRGFWSCRRAARRHAGRNRSRRAPRPSRRLRSDRRRRSRGGPREQ